MSEETFKKGLERRTAVMGEAYVAQSMRNAPEFNSDFQRYLTENIWGTVWSGGAINSTRERILITLSMVCALGKTTEMKGHMRGALANGITPEELKSVFFHAAGYAGMPAALECFRAFHEVRTAWEAEASAG